MLGWLGNIVTFGALGREKKRVKRVEAGLGRQIERANLAETERAAEKSIAAALQEELRFRTSERDHGREQCDRLNIIVVQQAARVRRLAEYLQQSGRGARLADLAAGRARAGPG